jgi:NAD(P)H-hydrate epimerase
MTRLTRAQVRQIDRLASERYHVPGIVLMENAARAVADAACEMLGNHPAGKILVLCGGGNNGGDGLAAARHLHNRGFDITLFLTVNPAKYTGDALTNWEIASAMGLRRLEGFDEVMRRDFDLVVDAVFGTGLTEPPWSPTAAVIQIVNTFGTQTLAIDLPSGLDCDTGEPLGPCITATRTVTFVAEKSGFANPNSRRFTGEVTVGDIGCPRELIEEVARLPH